MTTTTLKLRHLGLGLAVAIAGVVASAPRVAHAEGPEVYLTVKTPDAKDVKNKDRAPTIEATVKNGPNAPLEKFSISEPNAKVPVIIKASALRPYTEGTVTIAIGFVINGQEIRIGNDDVEQDDNAKRAGVLKNLEAALDKLQIGTRGPTGSKGVVISYSSGAEIKVPMGDLKNVSGGALGGQKDYYRKIGTDMVQGITMGLAELHNAVTARKALIVVGDGNDTNNEAAKRQLVELKKQAKADNIDMFAIIYKDEVSDPGNVITALIPTAKTVNSIDGIASEMDGILNRMADRYYLTFPGYDEKLAAGLNFDGKPHDLVVKIDQTDTEAATVTLAPVWNPPKPASFPWLLVIIIGVVVLLLLIIIIARASRKEVPMPAPVEMPMAPMVAAPAAMPAGPMKTVMMSAGGSDGFPIVGWLVPLNGPNAFQTYKLIQGITKIGTAPPSHIIVNDGFLSTEHCQVVCSAKGFELIDNGSTNGCYVNDRKSTKQELVDNDMITLGKTHFKFKSIN